MKEISIFCFGFGQVAKNFISKIRSKKIKINLSITSREDSQIKKFEEIRYESFKFNESFFDKKLIEKLKKSDYILVSIAPINGTDIVIKNFKSIIEENQFRWITYLSATSVYGDHKGEWVDEKSNTEPTSENGVERLKAEKSWMDLASKKNLPLQIFRLSGIYSNKRNILARLKSGEAKIINKKNQFFSRIHVDDISNILFKSLENFKPKEIYNISDDKPASSSEVTLYGAKLLKMDKPKTIDLSLIKNEMLKNFYKDSKKVSNKKMKKVFNYDLKFPTYIEGLNYIRDNFI
ncbi:MAG: NAD-dependent epimerase/dehydratase family protein [Pelagibacteraceae bacterium]